MNIEVIHIRDIHEYSYIHDHVASVVGDGESCQRTQRYSTYAPNSLAYIGNFCPFLRFFNTEKSNLMQRSWVCEA